MATITKSFTENYYSSNKSTWTVTLTQSDISVSDATFSLATSGIAKYVGSNKGRAEAVLDDIRIYRSSSYAWADIVSHVTLARPEGAEPMDMETSGGNAIAWNSNANVTLYRTMNRAINTANCFNESNNTVKTITLYAQVAKLYLASKNSSGNYYNHVSLSDYNLGALVNVTLNAPPTFKVVDGEGQETTSVSFDTPTVYANLTTASVNVDDIVAKYDGYISSVAFTIGNQTATGSTSGGTLSIPLNAGGIFAPTVTVTDSRGQTTTKVLDTITVNTYTVPSVSFDIDRTASTGVDDDEGESAVAVATFSWTDAVATLSAPTVSVTDSDGAPVAVTTTWYKDRALTTAISDWSTITANDMPVYGLIDNVSHDAFDAQYSYQVSITPNDSEGSGIAITQTLGSAFYTIDFLAGGHGIAFGQPSSRDGFECSMTTIFHDTVDVEDALTAQSVTADENLQGQNALLELDTDTASGTDYDIYTALVALGWTTDVIV